jgi:hypothetical protein
MYSIVPHKYVLRVWKLPESNRRYLGLARKGPVIRQREKVIRGYNQGVETIKQEKGICFKRIPRLGYANTRNEYRDE